MVRNNAILGTGVLEPGHHPDAIQFATRPNFPSTNISIIDNQISGHMQGIFLGDPKGGYYKVVITGNSVKVDFPNGIYAQNAELKLGSNTLGMLEGGVRGSGIKIIKPISTEDIGGNLVNGRRKDLTFKERPPAEAPDKQP